MRTPPPQSQDNLLGRCSEQVRSRRIGGNGSRSGIISNALALDYTQWLLSRTVRKGGLRTSIGSSCRLITGWMRLTSRVSTDYSFFRLSRSALPTTLTEDSAIAAAAIIGESKMPKTG